MRRTMMPMVLAGLLTLALAFPAAGAMFARGTFADAGTDGYTCGDAEIAVSWEASGRFHLRTGKGDLDSFFFEHVNIAFHEVHTNLDTGQSFTLSGRLLDKEIRATRVGGTVFEATRIIAGQPFTVRDSDGRVVLRDRGVVVVTYLFDTLGDDVPGGDFLDELSVELRGPHPGWDFDICQLWER